MKKLNDLFTRFTSVVSSWLGRPWIFVAALALLILWGLSGPLLGFSDTWQLIVNTSTTIITFLVVFIIQNTQNRDNLAMNVKQDAIMRKLGIADKELVEAEEQTDTKLETHVKQVQRKTEKNPSKKASARRRSRRK